MSNHSGHEIISETQFFLRMIKHLLYFPYLFIMFLFGKKTKKEAFAFYYELGHFFKDARGTYYLIIANIVMFFIEIFIIIPSGSLDLFVASPENLFSGNFILSLVHMFLHAGYAHLLGNMLFLFVFGRVVEKYLGTTQMLSIYFGAGILSEIISAGLFLNSGIGASGAISGIVAAAILIRPFYFSYISIFPLPIFFIGFLSIMGDFTGFFYPDPTSNVGHIAHLAGYASVMFTVFLLNKEKRNEMKKGFLINILLLALFIILNILY